MEDNRRRRIGIVGGGASGLATAYALREAGFTRVTVLEREAEPGGKCCTIWHDGRSYELGAAIITPAYRKTWDLAKRHGVTPKLRLGISFVEAESGRAHVHPYLPPGMRALGAVGLAAQIARVFVSDLARRKQQFPRLDTACPSLMEPFESWCAKNGMLALLEAMRPWATAFGYGHMDEVPAAYMLNYLCLAGPTYELHEEGYRGLWLRVAKNLDVRCNVAVTRVVRGDGVKVWAGSETLEFDDVVIACPLEAALSFLDVDEHERSLFAQVRYMDYQVIAADVSGLARWRYSFVPANFGRNAADKPMFYYRRYADSGLTTFYSFRGERGLEGAKDEVVRLVERMGGKVRSVVTTRNWRYFPHVSSESMRAGFYAQMEALQGLRNTYYASEILSFSCVEPVVAYAADLVQRRFARPLTVDSAPRLPHETRSLWGKLGARSLA